jgi:hypothetical protein
MKTKMTKIDRVIQALLRTSLTRKQIAARFKIPNVRAILFDIKRKGYEVYTEGNRVAVGNTAFDLF